MFMEFNISIPIKYSNYVILTSILSKNKKYSIFFFFFFLFFYDVYLNFNNYLI